MSSSTIDEGRSFLEHFGVKGMKWGVRRKRSAVTTTGERHPSSSDAKKVSSLLDRDPDQLSSNQLKTINARLNLEQNYRRLNPTKMERIRARANEVLNTLDMGVRAYNIVKSPAGQAILNNGKKALKKP